MEMHYNPVTSNAYEPDIDMALVRVSNSRLFLNLASQLLKEELDESQITDLITFCCLKANEENLSSVCVVTDDSSDFMSNLMKQFHGTRVTEDLTSDYTIYEIQIPKFKELHKDHLT